MRIIIGLLLVILSGVSAGALADLAGVEAIIAAVPLYIMFAMAIGHIINEY